MAARCYWCETGQAPGHVPTPVGTRGEPLGCCQYCHIFSCGEHGERDFDEQEFKCYRCLFKKLVASAVDQVDLGQEEKEALIAWDKVWKAVFAFLEKWSASDRSRLSEFRASHSQWPFWKEKRFLTPFEDGLWPDKVQHIMGKFQGDAEVFLKLAGMLLLGVLEENLPTEYTSPFTYSLLHIVNNSQIR